MELGSKYYTSTFPKIVFIIGALCLAWAIFDVSANFVNKMTIENKCSQYWESGVKNDELFILCMQ